MGLIYKTCVDGDFDEAYTCDPCFTAENGNVRSLVLIRNGTAIAFPLVKFDWELQVGLGNIFIMPETRGSFDGGTPKYITGYGSVKEKKVGDDYVLSVKDPNYVDNVAFYQEAEKHLWNIAYLSETQLNYVAQDVTITAKAPIEEDLETDVAWDLELKWFSKIKPVTAAYTTIASLFLNDGSGFEYEVITGLSLASGTVTQQQVTLFTNSTPYSYVILPDGSKLTTDGSGEINTTWAGATGDVVIVIPKGNPIALSDGGNSPADFIGQLIANTPEIIQIDGCINITSVTAPFSTVFSSAGCTSLESISAPKVTEIDASGCALTEAGLITLVTGIWNAGTTDGTMDISGGTSVAPQGIAEPYKTYYSNLVSQRNWTVTANT